MIEDESDYRTVSRYIHLNPVRAGLVDHPARWAWSSYPGYDESARRVAWVAYEAVLAAWRGESGSSDAAGAYARFHETALGTPPPSPFREAFGGWVLGSANFVAQLRGLASGAADVDPLAPETRRLLGLDPDDLCAAVAADYGIDPTTLRRRGDAHIARRCCVALPPAY